MELVISVIVFSVVVRDPSQSQPQPPPSSQSPVTTHTWSQSPRHWPPAPVTGNLCTIQKHAPSSHSLSGLPFTTSNWHQTQCALTGVYFPFSSPSEKPLILVPALLWSCKWHSHHLKANCSYHQDTHLPVSLSSRSAFNLSINHLVISLTSCSDSICVVVQLLLFMPICLAGHLSQSLSGSEWKSIPQPVRS